MMTITLQRPSGEWVESGWRGDSKLREVLAEETRFIAARRVDCFGRVTETRQQAFDVRELLTHLFDAA